MKQKEITDIIAKLALPIGGLLISFYVVKEFVLGVKTALGKTDKPKRKIVEEFTEHAETLEVNGLVSLNQFEVNGVVNALTTAFSYNGLLNLGGTDEESVISILKEEYSTYDREYIWSSFGVKNYYATGTPTNMVYALMGTDMDLGGWITAELSGSDLDYVRDYFSQTTYNF